MNQRRTELLDALAELCTHYPEWRFGQLISNVAGWADENPWDIEDDRLLATVNEHLKTLAERNLEAHT
jgi:hypothetical protein